MDHQNFSKGKSVFCGLGMGPDRLFGHSGIMFNFHGAEAAQFSSRTIPQM